MAIASSFLPAMKKLRQACPPGILMYFSQGSIPESLVKSKTQILIEFLDGTKKVQLAAKKSFLVAKKSSPRD